MTRIKRIMKFLTTTLILGLVGAVFFSLAEDEKLKASRGGDGSFFKKMDTDGDQAISKIEAGDKWERLSKLDKDEDNKVTIKEMMAARGGGDRPGQDGPPRGGNRPEPGEMFKRSDKNNDGKITKDEVPEKAWEFLSKLDKDGDDAISSEEAKAGRPSGSPAGKPSEGGRGRGGEMLKRADKNSDGKISKDEVPEQAWERLGKLDKDGDDAVSKEEMAAGMKAMREGGKGKGPRGSSTGAAGGGPGAMFSRFDKDENGKLSESEVPGEMWSKLRKADTDADGLVSKDELGKVYSARAKSGDKPAPKKKEKKDTAS